MASYEIVDKDGRLFFLIDGMTFSKTDFRNLIAGEIKYAQIETSRTECLLRNVRDQIKAILQYRKAMYGKEGSRDNVKDRDAYVLRQSKYVNDLEEILEDCKKRTLNLIGMSRRVG